jgi:hypothetical protein
MLNLPIANLMRMRILKVLPLILFFAALAEPVAAQQTEPSITSPVAGDAIQGAVTVLGVSNVTSFVSAELAFTYANHPTETWFLIATNDQPVSNAALGVWDTTGITDGVYNVRLRVYLTDGTHQDALVTGLRVRNYTPIETATPVGTSTLAPAPVESTPVATATSTSMPFPTPTLLPTNPATVTTGDVNNSLVYGALIAIVIISTFGVIARFRRRNF